MPKKTSKNKPLAVKSKSEKNKKASKSSETKSVKPDIAKSKSFIPPFKASPVPRPSGLQVIPLSNTDSSDIFSDESLDVFAKSGNQMP